MRNLKLVEAVIQLKEIAKLVETETVGNMLAVDISRCADRLHELSIIDNQVSEIIEKAKQ